MYHSENGLFFQRTSDGVRILKTSDGREPGEGNVILDQTISDGTWCSAVCSVSAEGEGNNRWYDAVRFHGEAPVVDVAGDGSQLPPMPAPAPVAAPIVQVGADGGQAAA